jgi:hypothetical protein
MKHLSPLEQRLEEAARELRQAARHSVPPPIDDRARSRIPSGWLVFATAFAVVILAMGLIPLLSGPGERDGTLAEPTPSIPPVTTGLDVVDTTTTSIGSAVDDVCSATGLAVPADQEGLPAPVAQTRKAIAEAAVDCHIDALGRLAGVGPNGRGGPELVTSFGGGGFMNIVEWEDDGEEPLELIVKLLDTPYAVQDYEELPTHYYWPSAFVYDSWEEIPPADLDALRTVYTQQELDQIAGFGSYAGWRIGITEDGEWRFFVAGD